jgi:hypothetical protein
MGSSSIVLPNDIGVTPSELLELVAMPSETEHTPKQLSGSVNDVVRAVVGVVDAIVLRMMEERTAEGFSKTRAEVFPQYFTAMVALGALIRITVPERDMDWLTSQSLSELEADFRDSGAAKFGSELRDRGLFTVWTLRKLYDLSRDLKSHKSESDGNSARNFAIHAVWARFHIDCLVRSIKSNKPIFPDVVENIVDGLRAAVNAYAWLRHLVDRSDVPDAGPQSVPWEEEDEILLSDSMRDIGHKPS